MKMSYTDIAHRFYRILHPIGGIILIDECPMRPMSNIVNVIETKAKIRQAIEDWTKQLEFLEKIGSKFRTATSNPNPEYKLAQQKISEECKDLKHGIMILEESL